MSRRKKYPGLHKTGPHAGTQEFVDYDYLDKLSEEELRFLDQFTEEYYRNYFKRENALTPPGEARRKYFDRNNARNRDRWNKEPHYTYIDDLDDDEDSDK